MRNASSHYATKGLSLTVVDRMGGTPSRDTHIEMSENQFPWKINDYANVLNKRDCTSAILQDDSPRSAAFRVVCMLGCVALAPS